MTRLPHHDGVTSCRDQRLIHGTGRSLYGSVNLEASVNETRTINLHILNI